MPKYYVSSGDLNVACNSENADKAALAAFKGIKDSAPISHLSKLTVVSEHGFNTGRDDDMYYITCDLLNETGQLADFKSAEWIE